MWIVRLALRRPYTFVVAAILVAILGVIDIITTPTDIFPDIKIPVISVIFNYSGMTAQDMEQRIITGFERILTTTVNDVEHTESQSLTGIGIVRVYFQPNARIETGIAQVTAICQTAIRFMPPGTQPPRLTRCAGAKAHRHVAPGCEAEMRGAESRIKISCCSMCALNSCSPSSWMGEVKAKASVNQPAKKLA